MREWCRKWIGHERPLACLWAVLDAPGNVFDSAIREGMRAVYASNRRAGYGRAWSLLEAIGGWGSGYRPVTRWYDVVQYGLGLTVVALSVLAEQWILAGACTLIVSEMRLHDWTRARLRWSEDVRERLACELLGLEPPPRRP